MRARRLRTSRVVRWGVRLTAGALALGAVGAWGGYAASERRLSTRFPVPEHAFTVPTDAGAIARGERLATVKGCVDCHGADYGGRIMIDDPAVGQVVTANLTAGRVGGPLTDREWELAVRHGLKGDGRGLVIMPSQEMTNLTDEDLGAIAAYIRTRPAVRRTLPRTTVGPILRGLHLAGKAQVVPAEVIDHAEPHRAHLEPAPTAAYGEYLALGCTGCHGSGFSGGRIPGAPPDWKPAANITPAGIGRWSEADFVRALRTGRRPDGSAIAEVMPWKLTAQMTDVELRALYAYLRTLPPTPYGQR